MFFLFFPLRKNDYVKNRRTTVNDYFFFLYVGDQYGRRRKTSLPAFEKLLGTLTGAQYNGVRGELLIFIFVYPFDLLEYSVFFFLSV